MIIDATFLYTALVMLATAHVSHRVGASRGLSLALAGAVCVICLITVATGAHHTAIELWQVLRESPQGAISTPRGIIALCASIKKAAASQLPQVMVLVLSLYLTLQTFCIPGTIALNAICGALLGLGWALPICVVAGTAGASCCYLLSAAAGTRLIDAVDARLMNGKGVPKLRAQVNKFRADLFVYLLFLRLTPILPNWLINLASPVAHVPLSQFALATLLGITPQTYLAVRFGTLANADLSSIGSIVTVYDTALIACLGFVVLLVSKLKKKFADDAAPPGGHAAAASSATGPANVGVARRTTTPEKRKRLSNIMASI